MVDTDLQSKYELADSNYLLGWRYIHKHKVPEEDQDLVWLGFWKAILTYDASKTNQLSTYVFKVIHNELAMNMRKKYQLQNRGVQVVSLQEPANCMKNDHATLEDSIADEFDIEADVQSADNVEYVLNRLSDRELFVIKRAIDGVRQVDIAKEIQTSQTQVSRILKGVAAKLSSYQIEPSSNKTFVISIDREKTIQYILNNI